MRGGTRVSPCVDRVDGVEELREGRSLREESAGAELHRRGEGRLVAAIAQDEDTAAGRPLTDRERRVRAVPVRKVRVDERHVRAGALRLGDRLHAVTGLGDHHDVVAAVQEGSDRFAHQRLRVREEHLDRFLSWVQSALTPRDAHAYGTSMHFTRGLRRIATTTNGRPARRRVRFRTERVLPTGSRGGDGASRRRPPPTSNGPGAWRGCSARACGPCWAKRPTLERSRSCSTPTRAGRGPLARGGSAGMRGDRDSSDSPFLRRIASRCGTTS